MASVNNTSNTSTTSSYSYLQYKNKIGGLVSGMDIDSIMEKLMKAESAQMEKLQQQKQKYEWKRDAYREVNTALDSFQKGIFDNYGLKSSWNAKTVSVSSSAVSATATSSANGTLNIEEAKLATAGRKVVTLNSVDVAKSSLSQDGIAAVDGVFSFKDKDGKEKTISYSKDETVSSLINKLNESGSFDASVQGGKLIIRTKEEVTLNDESSKTFATNLGFTSITDDKISAGETVNSKGVTNATQAIDSTTTIGGLGLDSGEFKIKAIDGKGGYIEKTISYSSTDKLSDVMSRINSSGVGVTALISTDNSGNTSLSLTSNLEGNGADGAINITSDTKGLFEKLGVLSSGKTGVVASGSNGYIVANGVKIEGTSNKYTVSGYQLTINENIQAGNAPAKISSTTDTDKIVDKVKEFVETYNGLIKDLNTRVSEKKKVGYAPLTDAQKAEMKDPEIEKWEKAAKEGLLKGDSTLNTVLSNMRTTLSTYGNGSEDMLFKIGITTSKTYTDNGKLEIDEDKLRKALSDDPEIVSRIFTGDSSTGAEGIISKVRTTAQSAVATIKNTAGSESSSSDLTYSLGKTITSLDDKISDWKDRLKDIEERYWNQFSAMETAIQKANSQSSIFDQY